jgi:HEAT repeat protein
VDALIDALRDPLPRVQLAAAQALGKARAQRAAPALEALAKQLSTQDAARVRRVLRELAATASEAARAEELELLNERLRKLVARVEQLEARVESKNA